MENLQGTSSFGYIASMILDALRNSQQTLLKHSKETQRKLSNSELFEAIKTTTSFVD